MKVSSDANSTAKQPYIRMSRYIFPIKRTRVPRPVEIVSRFKTSSDICVSPSYRYLAPASFRPGFPSFVSPPSFSDKLLLPTSRSYVWQRLEWKIPRRIQPGNRLGFVKVKSIGENRSCTYEKKREKRKRIRRRRRRNEKERRKNGEKEREREREREREEGWRSLDPFQGGSSLSCCRLCARHPDSIPSFSR